MGALVVLWVICGVIGYAIGQGKGRGNEGLLLGLLLGFIGLIIVAVLSPTAEHQARQNIEIANAQLRLGQGQGPYPPPVYGYPPQFPSPPLPQNPPVWIPPPVAAPPGNAAPGLAGQLEHLAELHRVGALSDAEFAAAKQRILGTA